MRILNKATKCAIDGRFDREVRRARAVLASDHVDLLARLYHLNGGMSANVDNVMIESVTSVTGNVGETWQKDQYSIRTGLGDMELWFVGNKFDRFDCGPTIRHFMDNRIQRNIWKSGLVLHRSNGPAEQVFYSNGQVQLEIWMVDDQLHNDRGPAIVKYYPDGTIRQQEWYCRGFRHCSRGPAVLKYYDTGQLNTEQWYNMDRLHRVKYPAESRWTENGFILSRKWYHYDMLHRRKGPAVETWHHDTQQCKKKLYFYMGDMVRSMTWSRAGRRVYKFTT